MIKSMTGFGRAVCRYKDKNITVEIKSLNSKQLDFNTRIPYIYKEKEIDMRSVIGGRLERGRIDLFISVEKSDDSCNYSFNKALAKKYYKDLQSFSSEIKHKHNTDFLSLAVRMPEVFSSKNEEISKGEWENIISALDKAINQLDNYRIQEGKSLEKDITKRIQLILKLLQSIDKYESKRIEDVRTRLKNKLNELSNDINTDKNRFEQEIIYYLEKLDITEEKTRLKQHCDYFIQTMKETSGGKKLGFIAQEIGREINTISSKANDADIQKIAVQMKDELEKIKEQLLNIL